MRKSEREKRSFRIGSGEKKIIIVLVYNVVFMTFALMAFTLSIRNGTQFREAVNSNFLCESRGHNAESPCDRKELQSLKYPGVNIVAYVMLLLFPTINFTYVINFRKLKQWIVRHFLKSQANTIVTTASTATNTATVRIGATEVVEGTSLFRRDDASPIPRDDTSPSSSYSIMPAQLSPNVPS